MVLYRKYRPQKLSELDIVDVREKLIRTLSSSYLPHAYLFAGPKGTGKTSAARIVAKILNCEKRGFQSKNSDQMSKDKGQKSEIEPCNVCDSCKSITQGRHLDIIEIDAASNRGIDEIRDLREKIKLAPTTAAYKVYIIDEVHMLTTEAFNALLKTLEEPPKHSIFILATTEPEKLPDTIRSRCIYFVFRKAKTDEIISSLLRVAKGEKLTVKDEVLSLIAQSSDGSFRDAVKLFEQALRENALKTDKIGHITGEGVITSEQFLTLLAKHDTKSILQTISQMIEKGSDIKIMTANILNLLHDMLLASFSLEKDRVPKDLLDKFNVKEINALINLFSKVYVDIKNAPRPELVLEVTLVEWCEEKS